MISFLQKDISFQEYLTLIASAINEEVHDFEAKNFLGIYMTNHASRGQEVRCEARTHDRAPQTARSDDLIDFMQGIGPCLSFRHYESLLSKVYRRNTEFTVINLGLAYIENSKSRTLKDS